MTKGLPLVARSAWVKGAVTDFKAVKTAASLYGHLPFVCIVEAPFRLETKRVILENGRLLHFRKIPYKSLRPLADRIRYSALQCQGNVNIQVLNALFGGVAGAQGRNCIP